ncbi:MAG: CHAD domain-containing [Geobacteraceae bacterium]|nr:MAG: CHAD domain-containing [Geobacteraceae bacterium]
MQLNGQTSLWLAARILLAERRDDFFRRWFRVLNTFDLDDIHDLRVASRRLREGLTLFAPIYPAKGIAPLVKKVKQVTTLLGEMRNTDEALLFFKALSDELDAVCRGALTDLLTEFKKRREKEEETLRERLESPEPKSFRSSFRKVVRTPFLFFPPSVSADPFSTISAYAKESMQQRIAEVLELLPQARGEENIDAQHRLRIAVKHFRYRMEIFSFLVGGGYQELHGAVRGYQDVLGKMHDLDVFAGIVRDRGFALQVEQAVLAAIAAKRGNLFGDFMAMLGKTPLETIGHKVVNAW